MRSVPSSSLRPTQTFRTSSNDLGLRLRVMLDAQDTGWLAYEGELGASKPTFAPPALPADDTGLPALHLGLDRQAERRGSDPCGPALVARLPPALLANVRGKPSARSRAALPQERDGGRDQADAERPAARSCFCPISSRAVSCSALSDYRCTHASGVPAVFTLLLQERDLIESLDFSALKGLKIGSAPTPKELLDAVEAAFGVPVIRELRSH